jgi:tetratricopeptide (TPR) repeat protein
MFVGSHVPGEQAVRPWLIQRRLLQYAARCSYMILNGLVTEDGTAWAYHNLGFLYGSQGKLDDAEKMYQQALQGYKKARAENTSMLNTVHNLGNIYAGQGKPDKAEKMYQRALQGKEKVLGAEHMSTLETVNNLGSLYADEGNPVEAEQMYQRALQGYEKALSAEHTSTLKTVNNLGILYATRASWTRPSRCSSGR